MRNFATVNAIIEDITRKGGKSRKGFTMCKFVEGMSYQTFHDTLNLNRKYLEKYDFVCAMLDKVSHGTPLTFEEECKLVACVCVSELTGKLLGNYGVSTSPFLNPICSKRAMDINSICHECYARKLIYDGQALSLEINFLVMNNFNISKEAWETLPFPTLWGVDRIEAHGDTASVLCSENYVKIMDTHEWISFGVWTKNVGFWGHAFDKLGKPSNCQFIVSSPRKNEIAKVAPRFEKYVDKIFTVYTKDFVIANNIVINCGSYVNIIQINHTCHKCGWKCYKMNNVKYVNELLKGDEIKLFNSKGDVNKKAITYAKKNGLIDKIEAILKAMGKGI